MSWEHLSDDEFDYGEERAPYDREVDSRKHIPDAVAVAAYKKSKRYALRHNCDDYNASDFASYAVQKVIEGRAPVPRWLFVDYFRERFGRADRSGYYKSPRHDVNHAIEHASQIEIVPEIALSYEDEHHWHLFFESPRVQYALTLKDASLVVAHYVYGVKLQEIAAALGLGESRISQRVKEGVRRMRHALESKEIAQKMAEVSGVVKPKRTMTRIEVDVDALTIDKGVEIPQTKFGRGDEKFTAFIKSMQVGDSFETTQRIASKATSAGQKLKYKMVVRKTGEDTHRVWRTE